MLHKLDSVIQYCSSSVVPDQRIKTLSPDQTRDVIRGSARRPPERMNGIRTVMRNADFNNQESVTSFGIQVDGQETEVRALA